MIPASIPQTLNTQIEEALRQDLAGLSAQDLINLNEHISDLRHELPADDPRGPRLSARLREIVLRTR
ncbi:hypothetical protein JCM10450v2_007587 [Rhodotorula kratochvilovae]